LNVANKNFETPALQKYFLMANAPKSLFKYVHPDRVDILEKLQIRFTQPSRFNDPFEMLPSLDGLDAKAIDAAEEQVHRKMYLQYALRGGTHRFEEFRKIQAAHNRKAIDELKNPQILKEKTIAKHLKHWDDRVGILSLSAAEKNTPMWAHYAKSHEGFLIEFDPQHSFFSPPGKSPDIDFGILTQVIYSRARPTIDIQATPVLAGLRMLKTKSEKWKNEKEWRVYQLLEQSDAKEPLGNEIVHLYKLPPDCIKRVVVGLRMDFARRARIVRAIEANSSLKNVHVFEAVLDLSLYDLKYVPLAEELYRSIDGLNLRASASLR
jgi:hypothetical protein